MHIEDLPRTTRLSKIKMDLIGKTNIKIYYLRGVALCVINLYIMCKFHFSIINEQITQENKDN